MSFPHELQRYVSAAIVSAQNRTFVTDAMMCESRNSLIEAKNVYDEHVIGEQLFQQDILLAIRLHLRKQVALLRRCKKPRIVEKHERMIGHLVSEMIETEAQLISIQRSKQTFRRLRDNHSVSHARLECRYFLQQVRHKLPRELRDMVYSHVIGHGSVLVTPPSAHEEFRVALPTHPSFSAALAPHPSPVYWLEREAMATKHIFRSDSLGYENYKELIEIWYKESAFMFDDVSILNQVLITDLWYFDIHPLHLIRHVTFRIPEAHLRQPIINRPLYIHSLFHLLGLFPPPNQDEAPPPLVDKLAHMRLFTNLTTILLHIGPGIDIDRSFRIVRSRPVEYWEKSDPSVHLLLDGLNHMYMILAEFQRGGQNIKLCLESEGECVITKQNTVWSPLGWLERTISWGLERE